MSFKRNNFNCRKLPKLPAIYLSLALLLLLSTAAGVVIFANGANLLGGFGFLSFAGESEIVQQGGKQIIRVPAGGDLQAAINRAGSGDTIVLQAGATYKGEIKLPNKPLTDFVTIQTSAVAELPENQRITPVQTRLLAKIVAGKNSAPAVSTADGANHYRFVGIEFASETKEYVYNLIYLAASTDKLADVPHDFEFDRSFVHSTTEGVTRRGLALNSRNTVVKNSRFVGFAFPQQETQGICGWTGTKNVRILNNYVEGGAENIMFGGSDPANAELIPQDIEIRGNRLEKLLEWKDKFTTKCLFEIKNAKRLVFADNYLVNNPVGSAFRVTVRNDGGTAPFSTIEDVQIENNVVSGAGEAVNILGSDDLFPSGKLKRLRVVNNLFLSIGGEHFAGSGYFVQISGGEDVLIARNTVFNRGNIATLYGDLPAKFVFRDNIVGHGEYGIHGHPDIKSSAGAALFQNNVIVNNRQIPENEIAFPPNNFWLKDYATVGFINFAANDFRLTPASRFKGKAANKLDIGYDAKQLPADAFKINPK